MFWKNKPPSEIKPAASKSVSRKDSLPTIITKDMNILGNLISDGNIDFNGTIQGNIRCNTLTIRHDGHIIGDVTANNVLVYGKVKGLIRVKHAELYASCQVEGIIMHETLKIEDGAIIDGKFKRTDSKLPHIEDTEDNSSDGDTAFAFDEPATSNSLRPFDTIRLIR